LLLVFFIGQASGLQTQKFQEGDELQEDTTEPGTFAQSLQVIAEMGTKMQAADVEWGPKLKAAQEMEKKMKGPMKAAKRAKRAQERAARAAKMAARKAPRKYAANTQASLLQEDTTEPGTLAQSMHVAAEMGTKMAAAAVVWGPKLQAAQGMEKNTKAAKAAKRAARAAERADRLAARKAVLNARLKSKASLLQEDTTEPGALAQALKITAEMMPKMQAVAVEAGPKLKAAQEKEKKTKAAKRAAQVAERAARRAARARG